MMISPLFDKEFINLLYREKNRQVFVKITVLDKKENAIEYIQGIATDGSVKIDGKNIYDLCLMSLKDLYSFMVSLENKLSEYNKKVSQLLLNEIKNQRFIRFYR